MIIKDKVKDKSIGLGVAISMLAILAFIITTIVSLKSISKAMDKENEIQFSKMTEQSRDILEEEINREFQYLSKIADAAAVYGNVHTDEVYGLIAALEKKEDGVNYIISDMNGTAYISGSEEIDISEEALFQRLISGENNVFTIDSFRPSGKEEAVCIIAEPVMTEEGQIGAVICCRDVNLFKPKIRFRDGGSTYIVNGDGEIILSQGGNEGNITQEGEQLKESDKIANGTDIKEMKEQMQTSKDGILKYDNADTGEKMFVSYSYMGINNWYLVNEIPYRLLIQKDVKIQRAIMLTMLITSIIMVLLGFSIFRLKLQYEKRQKKLASFDSITGLSNRKYIEDFYEKIAAKKGNFAFALFHVNFFRKTNNLFGYGVGSRLLKDIGDILSNRMNENECAARVSKDYFGLIVQFHDSESFEKRINDIFEELGKLEINDGYITYDYSCHYTGAVHIIKEKNELFEDVNNKLYGLIREQGELLCTQWKFYDEKLQEESEHQDELYKDILQALENREFIPYFYPQYHIASKEIKGAEVYARWNHPTKGIIKAKEFIPILEEAGCVLELDMIMLEETCKEIKSWVKQGLLPVPLAVNFSPLNLYRKDFTARLENILNKYEVTPELISLEFKESAIFKHMEIAKPIFLKLRESGFSLTIDGVGMGDTSFYLMEEASVKTLRLDRKMIPRLVDNKNCKIILHNIIEMAKQLDIEVIAEGVETQEQLDSLDQIGCKYAQGSFYGKPCAEAEFAAMIFLDE